MKILHTADWHIGRTLEGNDLYEEQRIVLNQIVGMADEKQVDINGLFDVVDEKSGITNEIKCLLSLIT